MGWVVLLPALAVLFVFNKRVNPAGRFRAVVAVATMVIAVVAGCGLAFTFAGRWFAALVSGCGSALAHMADEQGVALGVSIAVTLVLFGVAAADIAFDKKADKGAQLAAVLAPTAIALVIGGSMGHTGGDAVRSVNSQVSVFMHQNFGGS